jgi:hypothetical protein
MCSTDFSAAAPAQELDPDLIEAGVRALWEVYNDDSISLEADRELVARIMTIALRTCRCGSPTPPTSCEP